MARMVSWDASADAPCIGRAVGVTRGLAPPPPPPPGGPADPGPPLPLFRLLQALTESAVTATATTAAMIERYRTTPPRCVVAPAQPRLAPASWLGCRKRRPQAR